jgi:endoglucanase
MWDEDGKRDEAAFEIMHNAIRWGLKYDLMVLVDLHILRSHHFNAAEKPLWTEEKEQDQFIDLWKDLSAALHDYPTDMVAYEMMNEPVVPEDDKIILSYHFYEPFALSHYGTPWTFMKDYKGPVHYPGVIVTQAEYGVFSVGPTEDGMRWYKDMLAIFKEHNVSSANWNYKSDQFGWVGGFILG